MPENEHENHLDVYENRYELHQGEETNIYYQGFQNHATQSRYARINDALEHGYLNRMIDSIQDKDFSELSEVNQVLLRNMVNGITSEVGRALVGLAFLQLTIKSIAPDQCIRLHKGTTRQGSFSWVEGISMRTIDSTYNTPFLREQGLLNINKYGIMMTRSLAENYPYSKLYKAEMRGPFDDWIAIVDAIEDESMPPELGLCYLMSLLKNRSDRFQETADRACSLVEQYRDSSLEKVQSDLSQFFNSTDYSARAFEVVMHGLFQAIGECRLLGDAEVVPMSQMRSANKKHGNVGDIELTEGTVIVESWDAKYGKPYLRDELEELRDKLLTHPDVKVAGFVVDSNVDLRRDIRNRVEELSIETGTDIHLFSFSEWVNYEIGSYPPPMKKAIAYRWIKAVVESFAQKRPDIAPIDEPCDAWLEDLISVMN